MDMFFSSCPEPISRYRYPAQTTEIFRPVKRNGEIDCRDSSLTFLLFRNRPMPFDRYYLPHHVRTYTSHTVHRHSKRDIRCFLPQMSAALNFFYRYDTSKHHHLLPEHGEQVSRHRVRVQS